MTLLVDCSPNSGAAPVFLYLSAIENVKDCKCQEMIVNHVCGHMSMVTALWPWQVTRDQPCHPPANNSRSADVDLILGQRRRRWPKINSTLAQRLVLSRLTHTRNVTSFWSLIFNMYFICWFMFWISFKRKNRCNIWRVIGRSNKLRIVVF